MSLFINNNCTNCAACIDECPNFAISEGKRIFEINPNKCTECKELNYNSCCVAVCPSNAIHKLNK